MADAIEHELCANCKKEIPQTNYVMHTMHCARNIALCAICREPVQKSQMEEHKKTHTASSSAVRNATKAPSPQKSVIRKQVDYKGAFAQTESVLKQTQNHKMTAERSDRLYTNGTSSTAQPAKTFKEPTSEYAKSSLLACKYCDLELPKLDLDEHEDYCGTRTDKCIECGEFVMFKYKKLHEDSNHGFVKLSDEPGPRPSWDSTTERSATSTSSSTLTDSLYSRRSRLSPLQPFSMTSLYNMMDYIPPSTSGLYQTPSNRKEEKEFKDLSRRLDCKTEYIRNLLHDSASITMPLRTSGVAPRNHFNHNKGPAPQPPSRRRNPPTELTIPCEFCDVPVPHEDLIEHETGCRPDLARYNPRRRSPEPDDYFVAPQAAAPASPEVELPCEFCSDMIPASQLLRHQATCS